MEHSAAQVANYLLDKAKQDRIAVTNLKLQKLVFICFGWVSAYTEKDLFPDSIEAWQLGPVIPSLYNQFSKLGYAPITEQQAKDSGEIPAPINDQKILSYLQQVYNGYAHLKSSKLVDYTHMEGTPWNEVYEEGYKREIPKAVIRRYYGRFLQATNGNYILNSDCEIIHR